MAERLAPAVAARRLATRLRADPGALVLVDGPSGAGKSSFADAVLGLVGAQRVALVRLDALYPGWDGLAAGSEAVRRGILQPLARGAAGRWRRWDWMHDRPAEAHLVRPGVPLLVEGCGAFGRPPLARVPDPSKCCVLSPESAGLRRVSEPARERVVRVWVEAGEDARRRRALARDAGAFDPHWARWERQWRAYVCAAAPRARADLVVDGAWPFPRATPRTTVGT
ncbi:ATP-binding protein [Agromyces sp. SYSU T00194]|uniref:ATP-binding protein n=1 Tax=Agromyces chitinivorans TaxID=3158560 RepID=UPI00339A8EB6